MTMQELIIASSYQIFFKVVIFNNEEQAMITLPQVPDAGEDLSGEPQLSRYG